MSQTSERLAHSKLKRNQSGNAFGHYRYFSYSRTAEWDEGLIKITGAINPFNRERLIKMFPWLSFLVPKRMRKEVGFADIEFEAIHLTQAMGTLDSEVNMMRKDGRHMFSQLSLAITSSIEMRSKVK